MYIIPDTNQTTVRKPYSTKRAAELDLVVTKP